MVEFDRLVFRNSFVPTSGWLCPVSELPDRNSTASIDSIKTLELGPYMGTVIEELRGSVAPNRWAF